MACLADFLIGRMAIFGPSAACTTIVQCTLNLRNAAFWPFSAKALSYLLGENRGERP